MDGGDEGGCEGDIRDIIEVGAGGLGIAGVVLVDGVTYEADTGRTSFHCTFSIFSSLIFSFPTPSTSPSDSSLPNAATYIFGFSPRLFDLPFRLCLVRGGIHVPSAIADSMICR